MSSYWDRLLADATPRVKDQITSEMDRIPQDVAMTLIKATFAYDPLPPSGTIPASSRPSRSATRRTTCTSSCPMSRTSTSTARAAWIQMDKPEALDRILDAFLARVDAAETVRDRIAKPARLASLRR